MGRSTLIFTFPDYRLRHYATDTLHLDEFWFVDSYQKASGPLPSPKSALKGSSTVPWRYNLNTGSHFPAAQDNK